MHRHRPKVPANKYQIQGVAGKGTFGVVYFGVDRSTGEKIAIKKGELMKQLICRKYK